MDLTESIKIKICLGLVIILGLISIFFGSIKTAFGAEIFQQLDSSEEIDLPDSGTIYYDLGEVTGIPVTPSILYYQIYIKAPDLDSSSSIGFGIGATALTAEYCWQNVWTGSEWWPSELDDGLFHVINLETNFNQTDSDCNAGGNLWMYVNNMGDFSASKSNTSETLPYLIVSADDVFPETNQQTRVVITRPENNATTTSSVEFEIEYYINSGTNGNNNITGIDINISNPILPGGTKIVQLPLDTIEYDTLVSTTTTIEVSPNNIYTATVQLVEDQLPPWCTNTALVSVLCGFLQATQGVLVTSNTVQFISGTDPRESLGAYGNSIFSALSQDDNVMGGACLWVATSTCSISSPSEWSGCMMNVGIRLLCPTTNAISYATSTLVNAFNNKIPFGYFIQVSSKLSTIGSSTPQSLGEDVTVAIDALGNASTTIFSWNDAKSFMDNVIPPSAVTILIYVEWLVFMCYCFMRLIR